MNIEVSLSNSFTRPLSYEEMVCIPGIYVILNPGSNSSNMIFLVNQIKEVFSVYPSGMFEIMSERWKAGHRFTKLDQPVTITFK